MILEYDSKKATATIQIAKTEYKLGFGMKAYEQMYQEPDAENPMSNTELMFFIGLKQFEGVGGQKQVTLVQIREWIDTMELDMETIAVVSDLFTGALAFFHKLTMGTLSQLRQSTQAIKKIEESKKGSEN